MSFTNAGTINVSNGDTVDISSTAWSNSGSIDVSGGTLNLGSTFTFAQLGTLNHTGGIVNVTGTLNDAGATLHVGTGTVLATLTLVSGGTIENGTIADAGSGLAFTGGTLSGVTYDGTMNLSSNSSYVYVTNGLTMAGVGGTGPGTINLTGQGSVLYAEGAETLDNATVNIGNNSTDYIYNYDVSAPAVLTLGSNLTIDQIGLYAYLTGYEDRAGSGIVNNGTINADFAGGTFTIGDVSFTNAGTINVSNGDTVDISSTSLANSGTLIVNGGTLDITAAVSGTGSATISGNGTLELSSVDAQTVTFSGSGGTLELVGPGSFTGEIEGISGSGDILDLKGYDTSTTASTTGAYNEATNTTTLTVTDPGHPTLHFTLAGNLSASTWSVTPDGSGNGVDVVDPPEIGPSTGSTVNSSLAAEGTSDTLTFAHLDTSSTQKASFAAAGSNYIGTFSVGSVSESHGSASREYDFTLGNDQHNLSPSQTVTQSYEVTLTELQRPTATTKETVSVSIGGPGNDNFLFRPGVGADTIVNFNPQADTVELDKFVDAQTVQQLASLITTDVHGHTVIELGHSDSITIPGLTQTYLQAHLESIVRLH